MTSVRLCHDRLMNYARFDIKVIPHHNSHNNDWTGFSNTAILHLQDSMRWNTLSTSIMSWFNPRIPTSTKLSSGSTFSKSTDRRSNTFILKMPTNWVKGKGDVSSVCDILIYILSVNLEFSKPKNSHDPHQAKRSFWSSTRRRRFLFRWSNLFWVLTSSSWHRRSTDTKALEDLFRSNSSNNFVNLSPSRPRLRPLRLPGPRPPPHSAGLWPNWRWKSRSGIRPEIPSKPGSTDFSAWTSLPASRLWPPDARRRIVATFITSIAIHFSREWRWRRF